MFMVKLSRFFANSLLITSFSILCACSALPNYTNAPTDRAEDKSASFSTNRSIDAEKKKIIYTIQPGDTLSEIAQRISGNKKNWRRIAKFNRITNPSKLRVGQAIAIPRYLILPTHEHSKDSTLETTLPTQSKPRPSQSAEPKPDRNRVSSTKIGTESNDRENKPVRSQEIRNRSGWILVNGNYFPRELTREPDTISEIVTQVWPGTKLQFVDRVNGWYKVVTDQGTGYLNPDYATIIH
jgi:LysM repeat protein